MKRKLNLTDAGFYLGIFASIYFWVVAYIAASVNHWWSVTGSAFSYLGSTSPSVQATDPWIYNDVGMIPLGIMFILFSFALIRISKNNTEVFGSTFVTIAGFFLIMIGIDHQGTPSHVFVSAWFFFQSFLAILTWGIGLILEERRSLGAGVIVYSLSTVTAAVILTKTTGLPGAMGEVFGIIAIELWVLTMFLSREKSILRRPARFPEDCLDAGEHVVLEARPSIYYWFQIRNLVYAGLGMFFFYYANYYLTSSLVGLLKGNYTKLGIEEMVGEVLGLYILGFVLLIFAAIRWRRVLPKPIGLALVVLTIATPIVMIGTWFSTSGDVIMIAFFGVTTVLLPLAIAFLVWWNTQYALTDSRVLALTWHGARHLSKVARAGVDETTVTKGTFDSFCGVRDIRFHALSNEGSGWNDHLDWLRVGDQEIATVSREFEIRDRSPRTRLSKGNVLAAIIVNAMVVVMLLLLTLVPVYSATASMNIPCPMYTEGTNLLNNPWPLIHNITIPPVQTTFRWWSGSPVWMLVGNIPMGLTYQNTNINSLYPGSQGNLTASGSGSYHSLGGTTFAGCVSASQGTQVSIVFSYAAPLVWE